MIDDMMETSCKTHISSPNIALGVKVSLVYEITLGSAEEELNVN